MSLPDPLRPNCGNHIGIIISYSKDCFRDLCRGAGANRRSNHRLGQRRLRDSAGGYRAQRPEVSLQGIISFVPTELTKLASEQF